MITINGTLSKQERYKSYKKLFPKWKECKLNFKLYLENLFHDKYMSNDITNNKNIIDNIVNILYTMLKPDPEDRSSAKHLLQNTIFS